MQQLVAFVENKQAYVLPVATGDNGLAVISQPKYIAEAQAEHLPKLDWSKVNEDFARQYLQQGFVSQILKQQLYVWWMKLPQELKNSFINK